MAFARRWHCWVLGCAYLQLYQVVRLVSRLLIFAQHHSSIWRGHLVLYSYQHLVFSKIFYGHEMICSWYFNLLYGNKFMEALFCVLLGHVDFPLGVFSWLILGISYFYYIFAMFSFILLLICVQYALCSGRFLLFVILRYFWNLSYKF